MKFVALAGAWSQYHREDGSYAGHLRSASGSAPAIGLVDTLRVLQTMNIPVTIFHEVPDFPVGVADCAARARMYGRDDRPCLVHAQSDYDKEIQDFQSYLNRLNADFTFEVFSPVTAFCNGTECRAGSESQIYYMDSNHLNSFGIKYLASRLQVAGLNRHLAPPIGSRRAQISEKPATASRE